METLFFFLFGYIISVIVWLTLHLIFLSLSIIFKRNVNSILFGLNHILSVMVQIGLFVWSLFLLYGVFTNKQWLYLIFLLIFGSLILGIYQMIIGFIMMPFIGISVFFVNKADRHGGYLSSEDEAEYISSERKIVKRVDAEDKVVKKLATFYLLSFFTHLIYVLTHTNQYHLYGWWDYILTPSLFMLQNIVLFGLPILIYNRFKHDKFIYQSKKYLLVQILTVDVIVTIGMQIIAIVLHSHNFI